MYRLLFENRHQPRQPYLTNERLVWIGRDNACQIRLAESGVSDRHAAIERRCDGYYVRDMNSANGVRLNGRRISEQRLRSGDELEIGSARLRFEIMHGARTARRRADLLQIAAAALVAAVIAAQLALLGRIFSETRPGNIRMDTGRTLRPPPPGIASADPTPMPATLPGFAAPAAGAAGGAAEAAAPAGPEVLPRKIRILRAERSNNPDSVTVNIQARAQVGERQLDTAATAICVQFAALESPGGALRWQQPLWLQVAPWENFATKMFTARFAAPPQHLAGFVVRTYYRNQLQDVAAVPATLRPLAPLPAR